MGKFICSVGLQVQVPDPSDSKIGDMPDPNAAESLLTYPFAFDISLWTFHYGRPLVTIKEVP